MNLPYLRARGSLWTLTCAAGLLQGCHARPHPREAVYVAVAPPPPQVEVIGLAPTPGYFWIGGYWGWESGRHVWVPGRWVAPRPGYVWVPHAWVREGRGYRLREGRWEARR